MFLPLTAAEALERGWNEVDFVLVTGDAYLDHPSFAAAMIGRVLEDAGYRVGIVARPEVDGPKDFLRYGRPRLAFLISAGNMDSMVMNYTANKKRRSDDAYAPGGRGGQRPDRATIRYVSLARQAYKGVPVVVGGIEASLRRLVHYDYWSNGLRRSILLDAKADLLVYGMGERTVLDIASRLAAGEEVRSIRNLRGTCWATAGGEKPPEEAIRLSPWEDLDERNFANCFAVQMRHEDPFSAKALTQGCGDRYVVQNPPAFPLEREELDRVHELPFERAPHPSYREAVPAMAEVEFSLTSGRGCFGGCSFCAITSHQGKSVRSRSIDSLEREARLLTASPGFKGYIHDVGGPTANFRNPACAKQGKAGSCPDRDCLGTDPCPRLVADHSDYRRLLARLRGLGGVKKVFVRSGIRYDYLLADRDRGFLRDLVAHHVSGQLRVAPEHVDPEVLRRMGKPGVKTYEQFAREFEAETKRIGKKQYLVPYFISAHPGSDLKAAIRLALYLKRTGFIPDQIQDFYPTPGTVSTCMWYTGIDPRNGERVYVPRTVDERRMQRALLHFHKPENRSLVRKALRQAGREDLIGRGRECLVPPEERTENRRREGRPGSGPKRGPGGRGRRS